MKVTAFHMEIKIEMEHVLELKMYPIFKKFILQLWNPEEVVVIFFSFIFISWKLITLQYCSDFCHTLT